jgi:hypothetical protein
VLKAVVSVGVDDDDDDDDDEGEDVYYGVDPQLT